MIKKRLGLFRHSKEYHDYLDDRKSMLQKISDPRLSRQLIFDDDALTALAIDAGHTVQYMKQHSIAGE